MSLEGIWTKVTMYFHYEFIESEDFPISKQERLEHDSGTYFIPNDFTIYQKKAYPYDEVNSIDQRVNFQTFMRILYHLPSEVVIDFLEFHFDRFQGNKLNFLKHVYHEFKGSTLSRGKVILSDPQQKVILEEWCKEKIAELEGKSTNVKNKLNKTFVNIGRINELKKISSQKYDLQKLIKMLEEINENYDSQNFISVAMLGRGVIDHIPPIFDATSFKQVFGNYGNKSFKKSMEHLDESMRSIADNYLHSHVRKKENLPNENQVNFIADLDVLLSEIIVKLHA